jgi:xanthine dehydrogenase accessory factor
MIAPSPLAVLQQALDWQDRGEQVALVTLVGIDGSSSRSLGSQMAITAAGETIGSFSGGCIDGAIVGEAQRTLARGSGATVRFGKGSPYIDVRLPCGGGIDLLFTPNPSSEVLRDAVVRLRDRLPIGLDLTGDSIGWQGDGFRLRVCPNLRIVAFGQGDDLAAFVRLAARFGADTECFTPDLGLAGRLQAEGQAAQTLTRLDSLPELTGDGWTAFVFLFHDHDWETALLPGVLRLPALYCGAIGSNRTHAARLEALRHIGVTEAELARLHGHIGLIPATRDPATLAVSILAEVAASHAATLNTPKAHLAVSL